MQNQGNPAVANLNDFAVKPQPDKEGGATTSAKVQTDSDKPSNQPTTPDIVKNIVQQVEPKEEENLLGIAPDFDKSLLEEIEAPRSFLLLGLKILFFALVAAALASFVFFTFHFGNIFDFAATKWEIPTISKQITSSNSEILTLQTDLNFYRYLQAKSYLDSFTYYGDSFIQNYEVYSSATTTNTEKSAARSSMAKSKELIKESFQKLSGLMVESTAIQLIAEDGSIDPLSESKFNESLTAKLSEKANEFSNSEESDAVREYRNYLYTLKLVGNKKLRTQLIGADFDAMSNDELYSLIKNITSVITNDMSIIQTIKDARIRWSDVINEIDLRTKTIDNYFSQDYYDEYGGIRYTSYDFDEASQKITIVGETKRFDTTNFTMISNLIDELNRSEMFDNAEMKSFSKSGSLEDGYSASLKLVLDLQSDETELTTD